MSRKRKGERPNGLIQVSCTVDGCRHYFYGHTRQEAIKKRDDFKHRPALSIIRRITVDKWVSEYLETYRTNVNKAYIKADNVPYNRLAAEFAGVLIADVTEHQLQASVNKLANMSFSTCRNYVQVIRRVFRSAYRNKLIADDPSADIHMPSYTKGTHRALEQWEIMVVVNHWNAKGQWAGLWVLLMLFCGLRRGEMMGLDWKDVDMNANLVSVTQVAVIDGNQTTIEQRAKSVAGLRTIPMCKQLRDALESIPLVRRHGFVCLSSKGMQLTETAVTRGIDKSLAVWSSIVGRQISFRTHDLRHTFATMLYESGVDVKMAQYLLGHADMRLTLQLYTHLSQHQKQAQSDKMISYLNSIHLKDDKE